MLQNEANALDGYKRLDVEYQHEKLMNEELSSANQQLTEANEAFPVQVSGLEDDLDSANTKAG